MHSLGTEKASTVTKQESYAIKHSFLASGKLGLGVAVKLNSDGTVSPATSTTDIPIGIIVSGKANDKPVDRVTVLTPFCMMAIGEALGNVVIGNELSSVGVNAIGGQKWKVSAANDMVSAIALEAGANGGVFLVGILRHAYKK